MHRNSDDGVRSLWQFCPKPERPPSIARHVDHAPPVVLLVWECLQPDEPNAVPIFFPPGFARADAFFPEAVVAETRGKDRHPVAALDHLLAQIVAARRLAVRSVRVVIQDPDVHGALSV